MPPKKGANENKNKENKNKNKNKKNDNGPKWSFFPDLHEEVASIIEADGLSFTFSENTKRPPKEEYDTNIMGRFVCNNESCGEKGWASKVVAITIRMYPNQQYNASVYHQRCKGCNRPSRPILGPSYAERVAYRLQKWSGVEVDPPEYKHNNNHKPHRSELCEGGKAGHCRFCENNRSLLYTT